MYKMEGKIMKKLILLAISAVMVANVSAREVKRSVWKGDRVRMERRFDNRKRCPMCGKALRFEDIKRMQCYKSDFRRFDRRCLDCRRFEGRKFDRRFDDRRFDRRFDKRRRR